MKILLTPLIILAISTQAQNYTSYHTGNTSDLDTTGQGGICLMGGASENDNAMVWFLERANQGDVLVLRASGTDGYNNYMYNTLGVTLNSVETIVFNDGTAANEAYIHQAIQEAEAIWFAGGDQWNYIDYWRGTAIDSLINEGLQNRGLVIGGTSAGMAIQGGLYFSAENGTVTSTTALNNPYDNAVTVDTASFLKNDILQNVITDTHYDNPDRRGRHVTFLARAWQDLGIEAAGIACEEYTAVCIDENGMAQVFGEYPTYDDFAYFIKPNCELSSTDVLPETCTSGSPLTWNRNGQAIKTYVLPGTNQGTNTFDLNTWESGTGGQWENWYIQNGVLSADSSVAPVCNVGIIPEEISERRFLVYPNPVTDYLTLKLEEKLTGDLIKITNVSGQLVHHQTVLQPIEMIDMRDFPPSIYFVKITGTNGVICKKVIKL